MQHAGLPFRRLWDIKLRSPKLVKQCQAQWKLPNVIVSQVNMTQNLEDVMNPQAPPPPHLPKQNYSKEQQQQQKG